MGERADNREPDQLRPVEIETDYLAHPEGSALIRMGHTRIICAASVVPGVPRWMREQQVPGGWLTRYWPGRNISFAGTPKADSRPQNSPSGWNEPMPASTRCGDSWVQKNKRLWKFLLPGSNRRPPRWRANSAGPFISRSPAQPPAAGQAGT